MALTNTQIVSIINGNPKPEETTLNDLVAIAGVKHANWFAENQKETDVDTLARGYADKMRNLTRLFIQEDSPIAKTVTYNLVIKAGNVINYVDVLEYNTSQWEDLVDNYIVSAIETVAGVTPAEKIAYDGL